ncbi:hypothetical protein SK128_007093 [Halocaridina rubra]|uniref:Uncharacterized protein n=1 Tax=Halocaridina rubra TaxID=373956 RepID=A0AAN9AE66_HALRR
MLRLLHKTLFEKAHRFHGLKLDQILPGVSSIVAKFSTTNAKRSEGKWISKLDYAQEIFNYGHRLGTRLNVPVFILHSRKPLQYDDVYRAMQHLVK